MVFRCIIGIHIISGVIRPWFWSDHIFWLQYILGTGKVYNQEISQSVFSSGGKEFKLYLGGPSMCYFECSQETVQPFAPSYSWINLRLDFFMPVLNEKQCILSPRNTLELWQVTLVTCSKRYGLFLTRSCISSSSFLYSFVLSLIFCLKWKSCLSNTGSLWLYLIRNEEFSITVSSFK